MAVGQVDAGLAPDGGVDLGDERGRDLDDGNPALVDGGAEAGKVADDAAAERDERVVAADPERGQLLEQALRLGQGLGGLAPVHLDPRLDGRQERSDRRQRGAVGDRERAGSPGAPAISFVAPGPTTTG